MSTQRCTCAADRCRSSSTSSGCCNHCFFPTKRWDVGCRHARMECITPSSLMFRKGAVVATSTGRAAASSSCCTSAAWSAQGRLSGVIMRKYMCIARLLESPQMSGKISVCVVWRARGDVSLHSHMLRGNNSFDSSSHSLKPHDAKHAAPVISHRMIRGKACECHRQTSMLSLSVATRPFGHASCAH